MYLVNVVVSEVVEEVVEDVMVMEDMTVAERIHLSCRAAGEEEMMSEASFRALLDFCSPSAAITCVKDLRNNLKDFV